MTPWERRDTRIAAALAALAFAARLVQASFPRIVGADGPQFILTAMEAWHGDWATGLRDGIHPGYPLTILLFAKMLGSFPAGGALSSVLFGSLAVVPLFAIARDMVGRRAATVAGLLLACIPYFIVEHSEVMSEGLFHFLYATSLALAWRGATRASPTAYALCGFVGGLAYLTRPEGVYCAAAQVGLTAMALAAEKRWRIAAFSLGALAIWAAVAAPLLVWYRAETGRWTVTKRGSVIRAMQTFETKPATAPIPGAVTTEHGWGYAIRRCLWQIGRTTMWVVLAFAVAGAALARGRLRPLAAAFLACLVVGYVGPPVMAQANGYPLSHRYVMPSVMFMLPFAGIAWAAAVDLASRRWEPRKVAIAASAALGVLAVAGLVRGVHPREEKGWAVRDTAAWLVGQGALDTPVYASSRTVGVYVGRRPERIYPADDFLSTFEAPPGAFVVVAEAQWDRNNPAWRAHLERRHRLVARFPADGVTALDRFSVYRR